MRHLYFVTKKKQLITLSAGICRLAKSSTVEYKDSSWNVQAAFVTNDVPVQLYEQGISSTNYFLECSAIVTLQQGWSLLHYETHD